MPVGPATRSETHHRQERIHRLISLGPFDLIEVAGTGAMAEVWRAVHREQGVPVAVKVITGTIADDANFQLRLSHEVRAIARLAAQAACYSTRGGHPTAPKSTKTYQNVYRTYGSTQNAPKPI